MAHNLRKFATMADYDNAELVYPAVSWIVSGDTLAYDKTEPQPEPEREKVVLTFATNEESGGITFFNGEAADVNLITGLTFNGQPIDPIVSTANVALEPVNVIEYAIDGTAIFDAFAGDLTDLNASSLPSIEFLIPSFITNVDYMPNNMYNNIVIMATTPPEASVDFSAIDDAKLFVPDDYVRDYENSVWNYLTILPLSEYDGNLPITKNENEDR